MAEGSISNVFLIREGVLRTPPLDTPVLPGIAREVVLELAGSIHLKTEETPLGIDDLLDADEVFLTNSMMQVMPVVRVEKHEIRGGVVGTTTQRLLGLYREAVRKECGPP
jgi:branched-chain amino acid aminotransferase